MTATRGNAILEAVHEAAADLRHGDLIDDVTMREFDAMCLPPVPAMTAEAIRDLRTRCRVSQPVFAAHLNVSKTAVASWEAGEKKPGPTALKLLDLVQRKGLDVLT